MAIGAAVEAAGLESAGRHLSRPQTPDLLSRMRAMRMNAM
jgi:hypothetical protein